MKGVRINKQLDLNLFYRNAELSITLKDGTANIEVPLSITEALMLAHHLVLYYPGHWKKYLEQAALMSEGK